MRREKRGLLQRTGRKEPAKAGKKIWRKYFKGQMGKVQRDDFAKRFPATTGGRGSAGKKGRQMKCRQMGFLWRKPGIWRRR